LIQPKHLITEIGKIMVQTFPRNIEVIDKLSARFVADQRGCDPSFIKFC
jgi:hypothetical protein